MRRFWPQSEAAQADYESLRTAVLAGTLPACTAATRFARRGLAGLITWPASEPVFEALLLGAQRARWSPHTDARVDAFAAGYALVLGNVHDPVQLVEARTWKWRSIRACPPTPKKRAAPSARSSKCCAPARPSRATRSWPSSWTTDTRVLVWTGRASTRCATRRRRGCSTRCGVCRRIVSRAYAYQVIVLDELARHGVRMLFSDAPDIDDDPQARLLTQVQGVIAEYERAKIAERYRRGKLYRSRAGEVISWKTPYGYRRVVRGPDGPAHLVVFEPEAEVVRRIFDDYVEGGRSTRQIVKRLHDDGVPSPTGKAMWGTATIGRVLSNEAYIGRVYYNRTELMPASDPGKRNYRQVPRPKEEWITIAVPPILSEDIFEAAQQVSRDNSKWSPRKATPGAWMLRGLVVCGSCGVSTACHQTRGRNGTWHRYYYCRNHDSVRAGGDARRCPERNIRAEELDAFVFDQIRDALLRPAMLVAGEHALAERAATPDDELLAAQLERLERKLEAADAEHRRLADLYQAGLVEFNEVQRRAKELEARRCQIEDERMSLAAERRELAKETFYASASTTLPGALWRVWTDWTSSSAKGCCVSWWRRFGSRVGRSRSRCASRSMRILTTPEEGRSSRTLSEQECQVMCVCVPFIAMTSAWWTRRSTMAATATASPKISVHAEEGLVRAHGCFLGFYVNRYIAWSATSRL